MSVYLTREGAINPMTIEGASDSVTDDGAPVYDPGVEIMGRAVREDKYTTLPDGSQIQTHLTAWIPPDQDQAPTKKDRVTFAGTAYIVEEHREVKRPNGELALIRIRCRREKA